MKASKPLVIANCVAASLALCSTAGAATFHVTEQTPRAWTLLDPSTVEQTGGGVFRAPSITVQRSITARGDGRPGYLRTISEYDCAGRRSRWLSFTVYSESGAKILAQTNSDAAWTQPAPGAEAHRAMAVICRTPGTDLPAVSASSIGALITSLFAMWANQPQT